MTFLKAKSTTNSKWLVFFAVSLVTTMINMDTTIVNLALAPIAKNLHAAFSQIQWIVNIYMLTNIAFIVLAGHLSDIIGKRTIYVGGIIIFSLASILAGLATEPWILIFARGLQGIGFACTLTLGIVIVTSIFPSEKMGFALGSYMTVAGLAQALGPILGGTIIQYFGWRFIFLINAPMGALAVIFVLIFYRTKTIALPNKKIDWFGTGLFCMGLSLSVSALNELGSWGLASWIFWSMLLLGMFFILVLYLREKHTIIPAINFSLFKNKVYCGVTIIRALYMYGWATMLFILPLYLQNCIGYSPFISGLALFSMTLVFGLLSPIAGLWIDKVGYFIPICLATILSIAAFLFLAQLNITLSISCLITALIFFGISAPIMGSANAVACMVNLPAEHKGMGMGILYMMAFLGGALGVALSGSLLSLCSAHYFQEIVTQQGLSLTNAQLIHLYNVANGSHNMNHEALAPILKNSFVHGLSIIMYLCSALSLVALFICFYLSRCNRGRN